MSWGETIFLRNFIKGEKTFIATSDTVLKVLGNISITSSTGTPAGKFSFIPKVSGAVNIRITSPIVTGGYSLSPLRLIVYKDGTQISTYTFNQSKNEEVINLHSLNIVKDAKYSFAVQATDDGLASNSNPKLEICAIVVDSNYYE
jgi:hypothetical protein